mmetsp:Transcript_34795/g.78914  ORF Transcript_34795/g.78914 Transcript_34795/m.78914 type:complete len:82 (-) Transcript_34795:442-687(-)
MPWSNLEKDIILVQEGLQQDHPFQPDSLFATPIKQRNPNPTNTPKGQQAKVRWSARRGLLRRASGLLSRRSRRGLRAASQK